jgi:hypothetical protein
MNSEVKKLWLDALRSGEYVQAYGRLKADKGFCPLGVLCDIAIKNKIGELKWDCGSIASGDTISTTRSCKRIMGTLPEEVQKWSGIDSVGTFPGKNSNVVKANDSYKYTFEQLADMIEVYL